MLPGLTGWQRARLHVVGVQQHHLIQYFKQTGRNHLQYFARIPHQLRAVELGHLHSTPHATLKD